MGWTSEKGSTQSTGQDGGCGLAWSRGLLCGLNDGLRVLILEKSRIASVMVAWKGPP